MSDPPNRWRTYPTAAAGRQGRAMQRRILVADNDKKLLRVLMDALRLDDSLITREAASGTTALEMVRAERQDIILLGADLPDPDGFEVCRLIRRNDDDVPIIMLISEDTDSDAILALESGANDYMAKPVRLGVLLARVRAQLRARFHRVDSGEEPVFAVGPYTFHPRNRSLLDAKTKRTVRLTGKETAILKCLLRADNQVVDRKSLLGAVWGYRSGMTGHTLETHVYRIRQKIEQDPSNANILITEGGGYRLVS